MRIPELDWRRSVDGAEMLELATKAGVDSRLLRSVAATCARLSVHLVGRHHPVSYEAIKAVESFGSGAMTEETMLAAIRKNDEEDPGRNLVESLAILASSCNPENVVNLVVEALTEDISDGAEPISKSKFGEAISAACANIIRGRIQIENYPDLQEQVKMRNIAAVP